VSWVRTAALVAGWLSCGGAASAHRIDEYLQATLLSVESERVQASMRLVPGEVVAPSVIAGIDSDGDGIFSEAEQSAYAQRVLNDLSINVDAVATPPTLVSWRFPAPAQMREGLGEVLIDYMVTLPKHAGDRTFVLVNRHRSDQSVNLVNALAPGDATIRILDQKRNPNQSRYELDFRQDTGAAMTNDAPSAAEPMWWQGLGLSRLFQLGMHHIAEGTDHLLFLLALLLPAPLIVSGSRWEPPTGVRRSLLHALAIVTAFTVGHSITLTLAAVGGWTLPARPVEVLIALSILVSAVHALRPIFPGKEAVVAALFGLVHGLAFAATLDRLGLGLWPRVAGTLSFNLGIEAMQLLVIAAVLPSLWLMSRTPVYRVVRIGGALIAGVAALSWTAERLLGINTPIDSIADLLTRHAQEMAGAFLLVALGCFVR